MTSFFFLLFFFGAALGYWGRTFTKNEFFLVWLGFAMHAAFAVGQVIYTVYVFGYGDMLGFHRSGEYIANIVRQEPYRVTDLIALTLQQRPQIFRWVPAAGTSTGTLTALSAFASLLVGGALVTKCLLFSIVSFIGKMGIYYGLKLHLPHILHKRALIGSLLIPSVVFWTSGVLKESAAVGGMGLVFYAVAHLIKFRILKIGPGVVGGVGSALVFFTKSYVFFPLAIAGVVWFFAEKSRAKHGRVHWKLRYIFLGGLMITLSLLALGRVFPQYSLHGLAEETTQLQDAYTRIEAGSTYQMVRPEDEGFRAQVVNAPIAIFSALFRPLIFEVKNAAMFINALETSVLIALLMVILFTRGPRRSMKLIRNEPVLVFCIVFVMIFAVSVGLAAPNLGTLSRYRVPMLPAYWFLLLALLPPPRGVRAKVLGLVPVRREISMNRSSGFGTNSTPKR